MKERKPPPKRWFYSFRNAGGAPSLRSAKGSFELCGARLKEPQKLFRCCCLLFDRKFSSAARKFTFILAKRDHHSAEGGLSLSRSEIIIPPKADRSLHQNNKTHRPSGEFCCFISYSKSLPYLTSLAYFSLAAFSALAKSASALSGNC